MLGFNQSWLYGAYRGLKANVLARFGSGRIVCKIKIILWKQKDEKEAEISKVAEECDEFLKSLYSNHDIYVKDSKYSSLGEGNLDMFVVTYGHGEEKSVTASFDQYLVKRYDVRNPSMVKTSTYNWNNVKYIYPDLADARSETDSGVTSSIAQLS